MTLSTHDAQCVQIGFFHLQTNKKKSQTCEGGAHLRISLWHLLMNFEKPKKSEFWKHEKNCWRDHYFTHVYRKPQSDEVQLLRYGVRQFFCHFWPFFALNPPPLPLPNKPENQNFEKKNKISGAIIILNLCNKKQDQMMNAY